MKHKTLSLVMAVALLAAMLVPSANAALPTNMSWIKHASNPVAASGLCGVAQPSRPAVLVESANNYKMYFTTHPGTDGAQIYLATTTDGGQTWTCANSSNPVLQVGGSGAWDEKRVIAPTVIKDGSTYKMWYTGRSAAASYGIGYATSSDGTTWTKDAGNPVLTGDSGAWDSAIVREPSVVMVGSTLHMWYSGTAVWPYFEIGHATSTDGVVWTKDTANPVLSPTAGSWDANETYAPSVVMNGSVYEMFYSGNAGGAWLTGHASSNDGTVWTKDSNAIISPTGGSAWDTGDSTDYVAGVLDGTTWKVFYSGAGAGGYQIGLATLTNQPQLAFRPLATSLGVGNSTTVYIDLTAATNLYGYQFQVNYDAAKVSATGAFVNSWFDTTTDASVPTGWTGTCGAGVCKFAVSKVLGTALTGSGTVAQITFTGVAPGLVALSFSSDILSDRDANPQTHGKTTGWLEVSGTATLSGIVSLQGRNTPKDAGTVTLYDKYGYVAPTTVGFDPTTGAWSATVPVGSGTYNIVAAHSLYLSNQETDIAVSTGGNYPLTATKLLGGDANNSGSIEIGDLSCIGGDFGGAPGNCGGAGSSDINADTTVNILDLVLAGGNYDLTSPQPW